MKKHKVNNNNVNKGKDNNTIYLETKDFFKENWSAILTFFISVYYFIWQYYNSYSWDFQAFILGAKYLFDNGLYFEPLRPPLTSILLGIFGIFSWKYSPIIFIVLSSILYFYATYSFSKVTKLNFNLLYVLSFSPVFFFYAVVNGSELLSLSLFLLFIAFLLKNSYLSGLILGLASLTRYNVLPFAILLFCHNTWKKRIISISLFLMVLIPWFIYNFINYGNFFASIADLYALNIVFRQHLMMHFDINVLFQFWAYIFPFFILGIIFMFFSKNTVTFFKSLKNFKFSEEINWQKLILDFFMFAFIIFTINSYIKIPFKNIRYLFFLFIPTIYFSSYAIEKIINKIPKLLKHKKQFINVLMLIFIIFTVCFSFVNFFPSLHLKEMMGRTVNVLEENNLSSCEIASNAWVALAVKGVDSIPFTMNKTEDLYNGKPVVYFNYARDPDDDFSELSYIEKYMIYNDSDVKIFSDGGCAVPTFYDRPYLEWKKKDFEYLNKDVNFNYCYILFNKYNLIEGFCNFLNFNGFIYDE